MRCREASAVSFLSLGFFFLGLLGVIFYFDSGQERSPSYHFLKADGASFIATDIFQTDTILNRLHVSLPNISKLDGLEIQNEFENVYAVMIDNHPDARLQLRGLYRASIVYEALAEGGITRFLALYSYDLPEHVGPVRSARPYFIDIAKEYDASFIHAGGSDEALTLVRESDDLLNLEALYYEEIMPQKPSLQHNFMRDTNYKAPHNLFGSFEAIDAIRQEKSWDRPMEMPRFSFGSMDSGLADLRVERFVLDFSYETFLLEYVYDPFENGYLRFQGSTLHRDNEKRIIPRNVLIQFTPYYVTDDEGRLSLDMKSGGEAWLFTGGYFYKGSWSKSGKFTRFVDGNGDDFLFQPGQTWIEILRDPTMVQIVQ